MSADAPDAGEEEIEPVAHGEGAVGPPSRSSLELHLHGGFLEIDVCLKSSKPDPYRAGKPMARGGKYQDRRLAGRGRPGVSRVSTATSRPPARPRQSAPSLAFRRGAGHSVSFWEALSPAEQDQFRSGAEARTFAAGARLMREGETANYVVVILEGQTEICVDDQGTERIIARRGPGQLIGERAALQVSERSATVVALDIVRALVMHTEDFAAFLSDHPEVLGIVENQVYFRLTEGPPHATWNGGFRAQVTTSADDEPAVWFRRFQAQPFMGEYCTVIYTDVVGFSSPQRDDNDRLRIRHELAVMTYAALKAIWNECFWDDRGDGFLVVIPPTVPTSKVLEYLLVALPIALKRHNEDCEPGTRFQLRAALDVGEVVSDDTGVSGLVIINTKRLLDSPALKKAVGDSDVPLGLVVSESVYQYTVKHARYVTAPTAYKKIRVRAGDILLPAWMSLVSSPLRVPPQRAPLLAVG